MVNPTDPFKILAAHERWKPTQNTTDLFGGDSLKILPPLVEKIREKVDLWRDDNYNEASKTSKALLNFWFHQKHLIEQIPFQFFFAQREAIETIIYLYEVAQAKDKHDLMRFDSSGALSANMFDEVWTRYVIKMATGAGKTKVMGLVIVWAYFHKLYENDSTLSNNFLVITPNIIVLDRLRKDFDGLKMFIEEPFIPDNGFENQDWKNDFQPTLHIQDELKPITETGNIFLSNIHRVFFSEEPTQSNESKFLGAKAKVNADTSKGLDLGKLLRSTKINHLIVLNDEAHHIHDKDLAWFQAIESINAKLTLRNKNGYGISLQADFSATPKHNNSGIFVQTICDYPLVEAIKQNVVKSPVLPDKASREKLKMKDSNAFAEKYEDFMRLGYIEWEKQYNIFKNQKTPLLFVMTMSTKEADEAAVFLETEYTLMKDAVLTIHTKPNGEFKETEIEELRKLADTIDKSTKYKAVVSVLMLREGWDVRNVTTIVGLRPFKAESKILPEQTIGRGLRKMFPENGFQKEKLVVIGTPPFLEFVESLAAEGVSFEYQPMGGGEKPSNAMLIEVDRDNKKKNLDALDILLPVMSPKIYREYKNLALIDVSQFKNEKIPLQKLKKQKNTDITFTDIDGVFSHKTTLNNVLLPYRNVLGFFTEVILKNCRLVSGFDILYPKVEEFVREQLFDKHVILDDPQTIQNLAQAHTKEIIKTTFKQAIDELTISENGKTNIKSYISLKDTKHKFVVEQPSLIPKKSVFNRIVADNLFELEFASFLENRFADVVAFAKNSMGEGGVNFKIEYQAEDGNIREYFPDFFIKNNQNHIFILETKGREDLDDIRKIKRLVAWCKDANEQQNDYLYTPIYVKQEKWDEVKNDLKTFNDVGKIFKI